MAGHADRLTIAPIVRNAFGVGLASAPLRVHARSDPTAVDARILYVLEIVAREPEKPHSVRDLAAQLRLSPSRFEHLFRQQTGQAFQTFLRAARMAKAKDLLQDPTLRIKEVAAAVGYADVSNFVHDFRKLYGRSPSRSRTSLLSASDVVRASHPPWHGHPFIVLRARSARAFPVAGGKRARDSRRNPRATSRRGGPDSRFHQ